MSKTKIICTIGPSSSSDSVLRKMMLNGMDIIRLNFSHGTHSEHLSKVNTMRGLNKRYRRRVKVLQDLEGYRIRIGDLKKPVVLKKREVYYLGPESSKDKQRDIPFDYTGSLTDFSKGQEIYIDDGKLVLKVEQVYKNRLKVKVVIGGVLNSNKGVNMPGLELTFSGLTAKDKEDLDFAFTLKPDFIAQSFVRDHKDVEILRRYIKDRLPGCKIISKIENSQGVRNIDKILKVSDLIMIARGDLGVCLPFEEVPFVQKKIMDKCNKHSKQSIVATQMLESMVENTRPTRAETSDIVNAILDGAHMLLLSSETAKGRHPVEVVKVMNQVIKYTEKNRRRFK